MTPQIAKRSRSRSLSPPSLNKLQAKVLRAKLMHRDDADVLEREYEEALKKTRGSDSTNSKTIVKVLPATDARGRLYDVGLAEDDKRSLPGNRSRKKQKLESQDRKVGGTPRSEADPDAITPREMLRQERLGARTAGQKDPDAQLAQAIMKDGKFENDLDYIDDNAVKLGRQKMRSDAIKRQFALHDYQRTQKVMAECPFCFHEDGSPPKSPLVALGFRVYLSCTLHEELVEGHCLIVPIQHHLNMLEGDDDVWDEVQNFMKTLMRMFAEEDKGVIFYETVLNFGSQRHTFIECVPLPWATYDDIPIYFKESLLQSESEWSQHKKVIDFSARPGGFRRAMVPNLPYFMVQFDHKGEKGYGHVIENGGKDGQEDGDLDQSDKGSDFPRYFAGEIVGNVLGLEPRSWRRPRRLDFRNSKDRVTKFKTKYDKFDWTGALGQQ